MTISMSVADWFSLFLHYFLLSLLTVGGAISAAPDMHRFLVDGQGWLTDPQFSASIAIAQAAPGPNVLFVALMGWNVGLNAGGLPTAFMGMALAMAGIMVPSSALTYFATRWGHENRRAARRARLQAGHDADRDRAADRHRLDPGHRQQLRPAQLAAVAGDRRRRP